MRLIAGKWDEPVLRMPLNAALVRDLLRSDRNGIAGCSQACPELIETTASNRDYREQSDEHAGKKNDGEPSFSIDALFHK